MLGCIQPMSSPMIKRMFGFACCCAKAGAPAPIMPANSVNTPSQIVLLIVMVCVLPGCRTPRRLALQALDGLDGALAPCQANFQMRGDASMRIRLHTLCDLMTNAP